jgi:DNA-binding CsgD family transcriptional regulator
MSTALIGLDEAPPLPANADESDDVRRLVDALLLQAGRAASGSRVLIDVEIGDIRCILLRSDSRSRSQLTRRERDVARLVALGRSNKEIATELDISTWTVSGYLRRVFAKLGVCSRAEMVAQLLGPS